MSRSGGFWGYLGLFGFLGGFWRLFPMFFLASDVWAMFFFLVFFMTVCILTIPCILFRLVYR